MNQKNLPALPQQIMNLPREVPGRTFAMLDPIGSIRQIIQDGLKYKLAKQMIEAQSTQMRMEYAKQMAVLADRREQYLASLEMQKAAWQYECNSRFKARKLRLKDIKKLSKELDAARNQLLHSVRESDSDIFRNSLAVFESFSNQLSSLHRELSESLDNEHNNIMDFLEHNQRALNNYSATNNIALQQSNRKQIGQRRQSGQKQIGQRNRNGGNW